MSIEGLALTTELLFEVLSNYAAPAQSIPAVSATPGWYVVGGFAMPINFTARLSALASVSNGALTLRGRLYDVTTPGALDAVLFTQSLVDQVVLSPEFDLKSGHSYQMQIEVTGGAGDAYFGILRNMQLVAP